MTEKNPAGKVKDLAGGWITEREGTGVPLFLKLSYVGFCLFGLAYLFLYWAGETAHATRGPLVRQMNEVLTQPGTGWIAFVGVILAAFVVGLLWFAFRKEEPGE